MPLLRCHSLKAADYDAFFSLSTPMGPLGLITPFLVYTAACFPLFSVRKTSRATTQYSTLLYIPATQTSSIGHPYTLAQCPCLTGQQIKTHLVQYNFAPDTLPWLTRSRKRIREGDPSSAPAPAGEGACLSPVPTRKRLSSPHMTRNRRLLADLPWRTN
jgi:hypothetical protein